MDRQISEGCHINRPDEDIEMNGKLDYMGPVVGRVVQDQQPSSEWQEEAAKSWLGQTIIFCVGSKVRHWDAPFDVPWDYTTHSNYNFHSLISPADLVVVIVSVFCENL